MNKNNPHTQPAFSFLDDVEKVDPAAKPKRQALRPPAQIEVAEEPAPETIPASDESLNQEVEVVNAAPENNTATELIPQENLFITETELASNEEGTTDTQPKVIEPIEINVERPAGMRGRRPVKEYSLAAGNIEVPDDNTLFQKQYYSMGEVTAMFKENHSLIRYWESEFDILKPKKNGKGDRFFRPVDVKNLYLIYDLLRRRKFTIEGAKDYLKNSNKAEEKFAAIQSLQKIKNFFLELKAGLS